MLKGPRGIPKKEFIHFLHISQGSSSEVDTLVELSHGLRFLTQEAWHIIDGQMVRIDKMLTGLIRKLYKPSR
ncbi:MAG: four helix bundle protein [Nitrospirales bacterium]